MKKVRKKSKTKRKIIALLIIIVIVILGYIGIYGYAMMTPKMDINKAKSYYLYDNEDSLVFNDDDWISIDKISPYLIDATITIEDRNFYKHYGFDYARIVKAMLINIYNSANVQGASTITQQYARNLFLNFDKVWTRKVDEAILAIELEVHYSKDEILEGYLNTINYGGVLGIENASKYYFNKSASDLTLAQAAMLVGIPKSPSNYSPLVNEELANSRQKYILKVMLNQKKITESEYNEAINEQLIYVTNEEKDSMSSLMYYQDAVISELYSITSIPKSVITTGGLKIYTTLDMEAQTLLDSSVKKYAPTNRETQTASVMMDPNNGEVLALIGGIDYYKSQFNRATNSIRQIGSTIKPFLYYAALENGFTSASSFTSERTIFTFSGDQTYAPKNYNDKYPDAPISMGAAISYSDNIYAVKTHLFLGEEVLVDMLRRVGITTSLEAVPSLALGSAEFNMIELTAAYSMLANSGYKVTPHLIKRVEDSKGNILYEYKYEKEVVLNKSLTFIISELLTSTYDSAYNDYNYPNLISLLPEMTNKYAVKTGTTDTDLWIVGYTPEVIVTVWNGYDDNKPIVNDDYYHRYIWLETMEAYLKDKNSQWYQMPNNVVGVFVNPISGKIADESDTKRKLFYFIKGTEPYYSSLDLDEVFKNNN